MNAIIICVCCFILQRIRCGVFHTNVFSIYDPIYHTVFDNEFRRFRYKRFLKTVFCNICFMAICALIAITAENVFSISSFDIMWGTGLGIFCLTWPYVMIYRLYSFWKNPAVAVHLFINILEIVYALCITDFFLKKNIFDLFALLIPVAGSMLRDYTDELHPYYHADVFFQTKMYIAWKKIMLRERRFVGKYGDYINSACKKYNLPAVFLTRLMLIDQIEFNTWYSILIKKLVYYLLPDHGFRLNNSLDPGSVKPGSMKAYVNVSDKELIRMLQLPEKNIDLLALHIRTLIDNYPGAGKYISERTRNESPCGTIEYDALDDTAQLCRYIVCQYRAGVSCSRKEFADICTEILLHSEADQLTQ